MSWETVDFLELEPMWFADEINNVVRPFFADSQARITEIEREIDLEMQRQLASAKGEDDAALAWQIRDYEKTFVEKRRDLMGAAALHYIYESMKLKLREIADYFDHSHPAKPPYKGRSELHRMKAEFLARFNIDFEKFPNGFDKIEELVLARNAGIHGDIREYLERVSNPRFYKKGQFSVEDEELGQSIVDTSNFVEWVVIALRPLRKSGNSGKG